MLSASLVVHRSNPLNCETWLPVLDGCLLTPTNHHYVRSHFETPRLSAAEWRLALKGLVKRPATFGLSDLRAMPARTLAVTLECAGNGRAQLKPAVEGEPWGLGAVSTAEWTGVPLVDVLELTGVRPAAQEVVFRGADVGPAGGRARVRYERSLSVAAACGSEALLAYAMNGEPLSAHHGFPVRLVVPGWYGVASVKWLTEIEASSEPFAGFFQADRYVYEWVRKGGVVREPVSLQHVRALITEPRVGAVLSGGQLAVRGVAWSGLAPVVRVEVAVGTRPWRAARLLGDPLPHAWRRWELVGPVDTEGALTIRARAVDGAGRRQPDQSEWNRLGYGGNGVQSVPITITR